MIVPSSSLARLLIDSHDSRLSSGIIVPVVPRRSNLQFFPRSVGRKSKFTELSMSRPNEVPKGPLSMDWMELSIPSALLMHEVLSVAA